MAAIKETLYSIIEPAVAALGLELVGFELVQSNNSTLLRVYVDHENGIGIDAIEKVSRQISADDGRGRAYSESLYVGSVFSRIKSAAL